MIFKYRKEQTIIPKLGYVGSLRYAPLKADDNIPCCEGMKKALKDGAIYFGKHDDYGGTFNQNLNISVCSVYPEGSFWDDYRIDFCPFCSEKMVMEEVGK